MQEENTPYDWANIDIWNDTFDMAYPYMKCLLLEQKHPQTQFTYWLEKAFYTNMQREILTLREKLKQKTRYKPP